MSSKPRPLSLKPSLRGLIRNWWPVGVWLAVIRLESTDYASSTNTYGLVYQVTKVVFGAVDPQLVLMLNTILRKSGHFIGYAVLSLLVFLALKYTHRDRLRPLLQRSWGGFFRDIWQLDWAVIAVLFSLITAAVDEFHQTFLASRSGTWQDVALDTAGAVFIQLLLYARALNLQRRQSLTESEPSLTR